MSTSTAFKTVDLQVSALLNRAVQLHKRLCHFYRYPVGIGLQEYADSYKRTSAEESVRLGYNVVSLGNRTFRGNALLSSSRVGRSYDLRKLQYFKTGTYFWWCWHRLRLRYNNFYYYIYNNNNNNNNYYYYYLLQLRCYPVAVALWMRRNILFWNSLFSSYLCRLFHASSVLYSRHFVTTSSPLPVLNVFWIRACLRQFSLCASNNMNDLITNP